MHVQRWEPLARPLHVRGFEYASQMFQLRCFSTLNHIVGYCCNDRPMIELSLQQAAHGFQGTRRNVE